MREVSVPEHDQNSHENYSSNSDPGVRASTQTTTCSRVLGRVTIDHIPTAVSAEVAVHFALLIVVPDDSSIRPAVRI